MPASRDNAALNWAEQFTGWLQRHPLFVIIFFVSAVISAVISIATASIWGYGLYEDHWQWREREYERLAGLRAGYTLAAFETALGAPLFRRELDLALVKAPQGEKPAGPLTESSFRGRGYWVLTISDRHDEVLLYAVTACDESLRPTFVGPGNAFSVTLNEDTFATAGRGAPPVRSRYFLSAGTSNSHFFDVLYGGNPLDYKTFAWGVNDTCTSWDAISTRLLDEEVLPFGDRFMYYGTPQKAGSAVKRFRQRAPVNTYAETGTASWFDLYRLDMQIGVDRVLVRGT